MFHVVGGALLCPQGLGEISSKCTIPAHDKAVRGIGGEITRGSSPLLRLHIIQPPSDPPYLLSHPPQTIDFEEEKIILHLLFLRHFTRPKPYLAP